jgi:hypothetical protein
MRPDRDEVPNDTCNYFELFSAPGRFPFNPLERKVEGTRKGGGDNDSLLRHYKHERNQGVERCYVFWIFKTKTITDLE